MKAQKSIIFIFLIVTVMSLSACTDYLNQNKTQKNVVVTDTEKNDKGSGTGFVVPGPDSYDSADTAVLLDKNKNDNTVTLYNSAVGKNYTLSIVGTTVLYDKYGEAVSLDQIKKGDIVDVTFLKSKKRLNSMQLSKQAWSYDTVSKYEINNDRHEITIGQDNYKLSKDTLLFSDGRQIEMMDLNSADVLTVKGIDNNVLSICVEKGHGYLRLVNDENFIGGWIEIGQSQICQITEDMLLTVSEGSYQVLISHKGGGGVKDVIINRNEEVTLDIGDLEVAETQYGTVLFSLSPSKTTLYIDGELADTSLPVTLEYGIHQVIAKADGYKSITTYLKVGQASAGIDITLDAIDTDEEDEDDTSTTSNYYKVYIDAPEDVEVYLDSNYVGISPCSFKKESGVHIISLRKTGYTTRSYTVQIDEEKKDISYSFDNLVSVPTEETSTESNE